jgi:hypothetical protein
MKSLILFTLFASLFCAAMSQDLLVTTRGDSIDCNITSVTEKYINYSFANDKGHEFDTQIPMNLVAEYQRRYFALQRREKLYPGLSDLKNFRVTVYGGFSKRLGKLDPSIPSRMEDYTKKLLKGTHWGVDGTVFFSYSSGIGFRYSRFTTSNSMENIPLMTIDQVTYYGDLADHITISYAGPTYAARIISADHRHTLTGNVGIGYMGYHDEGEFGDEINISGKTLGAVFDAGYDFMFAENVALGIHASYLGGSLTGYEVVFNGIKETVKLEEGEYESLERIDISLKLVLLF